MDGLARLRLSSIEVNHVNAELVGAVRDSPTVAKHLHVPLQSGDDRVLAEMGRRCTVATYLRRLEPLRDVANLTADVIVGFPGEDEAAFERTLRAVEDAGITKVHVFPYSPRPGTRTAAADTVPAAVKKERAAAAGAVRRRVQAALGVEARRRGHRPRRPARPRLRRRLHPVARRRAGRALVRVRGGAVTEEGSVPPEDCLFCALVREGDHVHAVPGFVAVRDINPRADTHLLVIPERHVETFREVAAFEEHEAKTMLEFVARRRAARGPPRLPRGRQRGGVRGPDNLPPALARPRWKDARDARMTLIDELKEDLDEAVRERDEDLRDAIRLILNALQMAEKELQRPLTQDEELQVLQRERKRRVEAAEAFRAAGRVEQAEDEEYELEVLEDYMPDPLSDDELEDIVDDVIAEVGATSMRDFGRVMADVMPQVSGRADGSAVSQIVREARRAASAPSSSPPPGGARPPSGIVARAGARVRAGCVPRP